LIKDFIFKLADLDYNLKYYYTPIPDRRIELKNENIIWFREIEDFYNNKKLDSELLIVGPRGVGKTTTILKALNLRKIPRLYFPIKKLMNFDSRRWKKIILYEALYILNNEKDLEEFKSYNEIHSNDQDLIELIFEYIKLDLLNLN
jgi:predicted AAA+ superfamily ATPase